MGAHSPAASVSSSQAFLFILITLTLIAHISEIQLCEAVEASFIPLCFYDATLLQSLQQRGELVSR